MNYEYFIDRLVQEGKTRDGAIFIANILANSGRGQRWRWPDTASVVDGETVVVWYSGRLAVTITFGQTEWKMTACYNAREIFSVWHAYGDEPLKWLKYMLGSWSLTPALPRIEGDADATA